MMLYTAMHRWVVMSEQSAGLLCAWTGEGSDYRSHMMQQTRRVVTTGYEARSVRSAINN
jgi:hypothetical protein